MINIDIKIPALTPDIAYEAKNNPSNIPDDILTFANVKLQIGGIDYGGNFYLFEFLSDMFNMLMECIVFNKHTVGAVLDEARNISLRPGHDKNRLLIGIELNGEIYDEQEIDKIDLALALGRAHQECIKLANEIYPKEVDPIRQESPNKLGLRQWPRVRLV